VAELNDIIAELRFFISVVQAASQGECSQAAQAGPLYDSTNVW
jgi:hypothetical protein